MTTVVANPEGMAADQRCTSGGPICHVQKLHRIGDSIFGFAGDVMLALHMLKWLNGKRDVAALYKLIPESQRSEVDFLELSPEGLAFWNGWGVRMPLLDSTYAIGSGSMSALQALRLGKSPAEAVASTFQLDECSGIVGSVQVELLGPVRKRKRA